MSKLLDQESSPSAQLPSQNEVAAEFDQAAPGFWQVAFPPTDWTPLE